MTIIYDNAPERNNEGEGEFERIQYEVSKKRSEPGLSMPMDSVPIKKVSMVAVHQVDGNYQFVWFTERKILGKYTVFLFMGKNPSNDEKLVWEYLSGDYHYYKKNPEYLFGSPEVRVIGVMPRGHLAVKSFVQEFDDLKFPVIADSNGELSRAFGVMNVTAPSKQFKAQIWGVAKAVVILNKEMKM